MSDMDILERLKLDRKEKIRRLGESYLEWDLYCPYCAATQMDIWELSLRPGDDEWKEVDCQSCENHFMAKAEIRLSSRKCK